MTDVGIPRAALRCRPVLSFCQSTTPVEYAEWLVDASIAKTGAAVWYGSGSGAAHEGFYTDLFGRPGADGSNGYVSIVRTLKHVAQRMKAQMRAPADGKIPLWVCEDDAAERDADVHDGEDDERRESAEGVDEDGSGRENQGPEEVAKGAEEEDNESEDYVSPG
ncbi:hypothetical protein JCM10908_001832 [Rhodotorula pacifica]|uniref:uncharacterized protein n=1 Tax=Rhodotorula pacifica TaxID=1495444 RepID=UPI00316C2872